MQESAGRFGGGRYFDERVTHPVEAFVLPNALSRASPPPETDHGVKAGVTGGSPGATSYVNDSRSNPEFQRHGDGGVVAWVGAPIAGGAIGGFVGALPEIHPHLNTGGGWLTVAGAAIMTAVVAGGAVWKMRRAMVSFHQSYCKVSGAVLPLGVLLVYPILLLLPGDVLSGYGRGELFASGYVAVVACGATWFVRRKTSWLTCIEGRHHGLLLGTLFSLTAALFFIELYVPYLAHAPVESWYENILWNMAEWRSEFTVNDFAVAFPILGWHFQPALIPIVAVYWPFRDAVQWLYFLQAVGVALTVWPVFLLARHILGRTPEAVLLACAFAFHPLLHMGQLISVSPDALAVPVIAWGLYAFVVERHGWGVALMMTAVGLKETVAVLAFGIALYVWWQKPQSRRAALVLAVGSLAWLIVALLIIRHANDGVSWLSGFAGSVIAEPLDAVARIFQPTRLNAFIMLGLPWGFLALIEWRLLLALMPFLALHLAFTASPLQMYGSYYLLPVLPVVFMASVLGLRKVTERWGSCASLQPRLASTIMVFALTAWVALGPVRILWVGDADLFWPDDTDRRIASVARAVPAQESVAVAGEMLRRFSRRAEVYEFPAPVPARDPQGRVFEDPVARDAEWVVVDFSMDWRISPARLRATVQELLDSERYLVYEEYGPLLVLQRRRSGR